MAFVLYTPNLFRTCVQKTRDREGKVQSKTIAVTVARREELFRLFTVLSAATTLLFVRNNYVSTASRVQKLLQNYNILFVTAFPNEPVTPNQHFSLHVLGACACLEQFAYTVCVCECTGMYLDYFGACAEPLC